MNRGERDSQPDRLCVTWFLCMIDGRDHAVTDEDFATGRGRGGRCESLCGHLVMTGSAMLSPGPRCVRCHDYLRARASLRTVEERIAPARHRKLGWFHRLLHRSQSPVVSLPRTPPDAVSPERGGRTPTQIGANRARNTVAPTEPNTKRVA